MHTKKRRAPKERPRGSSKRPRAAQEGPRMPRVSKAPKGVPIASQKRPKHTPNLYSGPFGSSQRRPRKPVTKKNHFLRKGLPRGFDVYLPRALEMTSRLRFSLYITNFYRKPVIFIVHYQFLLKTFDFRCTLAFFIENL